MTVTTTANSITYAGNGTTTAFAFPYLFFAPSDLVVTIIVTATGLPISPPPVLNGLGTYDYTVTGTVTAAEYASGGTVTFNTAPPSGNTVSLVRAVPAIQTVTLIDNTKFPADTVNTEFDYLTVLAQQALASADWGGTALQIPANEVGLTVIAAAAASRANMLLLWDGSGNLTTLDPASIIGGSVPAGPAGGDLSGTYPNPTVNPTAMPLDGYLYGLTLSNSSTTGVTVAPGKCADSANAVLMRNTVPITKLIASAWAAGTGNGGLGNTVTRAASTWYHMFGGMTASGFDMFYDTSVTGAHAPAAFTAIRRLGSIRTLTGATPPIRAFLQVGDFFQLSGTGPSDWNVTNPGTAVVNRTIMVPPGLKVMARITPFHQNLDATTASIFAYGDPDISVSAATMQYYMAQVTLQAGNMAQVQGVADTMTNTASQIATQVTFSSTNVSINSATAGWFDTRGRLG